MLKYIKSLAIISILALNANVNGKPQDIQEAAILAFAQAKDTFDNGAAAKDTKEFEFMGAKMKNNMEVGFGDAIRSKRSSGFNQTERRKRLANFIDFSQNIVNSQEKLSIHKRDVDDDNAIEENIDEEDYSYDYSSSSSSSSSSASESEESIKTKRSLSLADLNEVNSFEQFSNEMKKIYLQK